DRANLFAAANGAFARTMCISVAVAAALGVLFSARGGIDIVTLVGVLASGTLLAFATLQAQIVRLEEKHVASLAFSFLAPFAGLLGSVVSFMFERSVRSFFVGSAVGLAIALSVLHLAYRPVREST